MSFSRLSLATLLASLTVATSDLCADTDILATPASDLLRGKHLRILDYEWPGFAQKDASATPHGWVGFDLDLIKELAARLGFSYEIAEMATRGNETWAEMLDRSVWEADLIMSYWGRTPERVGKMAMLSGHIDYSSVLVSKQTASPTTPFVDRVFQFAKPFDPACWAALILMIIASGVVDYLLERQDGGSIGASIYEYFAGVMWGGFEEPRSRLSAVYQIMLGFVLMIVVAACASAALDLSTS